MKRCNKDIPQTTTLCPVIDIDIERQTRAQTPQETISTVHNSESSSVSRERTTKAITFRRPKKPIAKRCTGKQIDNAKGIYHLVTIT